MCHSPGGLSRSCAGGAVQVGRDAHSAGWATRSLGGVPGAGRLGRAGWLFGGRGRGQADQGVEAGHRGVGGVPGQVLIGDLGFVAIGPAGCGGLGSAEPAAAEIVRHRGAEITGSRGGGSVRYPGGGSIRYPGAGIIGPSGGGGVGDPGGEKVHRLTVRGRGVPPGRRAGLVDIWLVDIWLVDIWLVDIWLVDVGLGVTSGVHLDRSGRVRDSGAGPGRLVRPVSVPGRLVRQWLGRKRWNVGFAKGLDDFRERPAGVLRRIFREGPARVFRTGVRLPLARLQTWLSRFR